MSETVRDALRRAVGTSAAPGPIVEWWWVERDGEVEIARVTFNDAFCILQTPPQPWSAQIAGWDGAFFPRHLRLLLQVTPIITKMPDGMV